MFGEVGEVYKALGNRNLGGARIIIKAGGVQGWEGYVNYF